MNTAILAILAVIFFAISFIFLRWLFRASIALIKVWQQGELRLTGRVLSTTLLFSAFPLSLLGTMGFFSERRLDEELGVTLSRREQPLRFHLQFFFAAFPIIFLWFAVIYAAIRAVFPAS